MPTYDYQCDACGHEFELFQRIIEDPVVTCPVCKKKKLRRLFGTGAAVVFKGSGFYQTDYRSESYKKGLDSAKSESSDSTSKKEGATANENPSPTKSGKSEKPATSSEPAGESKSTKSKKK